MGGPFTQLLASNLYTSPVVALSAGAIVIDLLIDPAYRHSFAGVEFYSDAEGATPVTASAGVILYTLTLSVMPNNQQQFLNNSVNAADNDTVNWGANVISVRATISAITGTPTHAKLRVCGNIS